MDQMVFGGQGAQYKPEAVGGEMLSAGAHGDRFRAGRVYKLNSYGYISVRADIRAEEFALALANTMSA